MTKKKLISIMFLALVFLGGIYMVLFRHGLKPKTNPIYTSEALAQNIQYPTITGDQSLKFFTGSAVAELNLSNFSTKALTREFSLPRTTNLHWRGDYALIQFGLIKKNHDIYDQSVKGRVNLSSSWWLFDIKNGTFKPIVAENSYEVVEATWKDDASYFALEQQGTPQKQNIRLRSLDNKLIASHSATNDLSLVGYSSKGLVVQRFSDILISNEKDEQKLEINTARKPLLNDGKSIVFEAELKEDKDTHGSNVSIKRGELYVYSIETGKKVLISEEKDNSGNFGSFGNYTLLLPVANTKNNYVETGLKNGMIIDNGSGKNLKSLAINEEESLHIGTLKQLLKVSVSDKITEIIALNQIDEIIKISTDKATQGTKGSNSAVPFADPYIELPNAKLNYTPGTNTLDVEINKQDNVVAARQDVIKAIQAMGIDPNQVNKNWLSRLPGSPLKREE